MTDKPTTKLHLRPVQHAETAGQQVENSVKSSAAKRRRSLLIGFLAVVLLPIAAISTYLYAVAADQYESRTGFVVRQSDKSNSSAFEFLGGISALTPASSTDAQILFEYIQSQAIVKLLEAKLNLRGMYSRPEFDPVFSLDPSGTIEDLEHFWSRMVKPSFDSGTGLLEVRVLAFSPDDANRIAQEIVNQSSIKINELSAIARNDATRYARDDLEKSLDVLKSARQSMTEFRSRTQIVDPKTDIQLQMGLISTLQTQLAQTMIELDTLRNTTRNEDPRISQAEQRIAVIQNRIDAERGKVSHTNDRNGEAFSDLLAEYERLAVDLEFAQGAYVTALAIFDEAQASASRQSRYLATYVDPTRAEASEYPRRLTIVLLIGVLLSMAWAVGGLIAYSIWDRR